MGSELKKRVGQTGSAKNKKRGGCCFKKPKGVADVKVNAIKSIQDDDALAKYIYNSLTLTHKLSLEKSMTKHIYNEFKDGDPNYGLTTETHSFEEIFEIIKANKFIATRSTDEQKELVTHIDGILKHDDKNKYYKITDDGTMYFLNENPNDKPILLKGNGYKRFATAYGSNPEYKGMGVDELEEMNDSIAAEKEGRIIIELLKSDSINENKKDELLADYEDAQLRNHLGLTKIKNVMYAHMLKWYNEYGALFLENDPIKLMMNVSPYLYDECQLNQDASVFAQYIKKGSVFDIENNIDDRRFWTLCDFMSSAYALFSPVKNIFTGLKNATEGFGAKNMTEAYTIAIRLSVLPDMSHIVFNLAQLRGSARVLKQLGVKCKEKKIKAKSLDLTKKFFGNKSKKDIVNSVFGKENNPFYDEDKLNSFYKDKRRKDLANDFNDKFNKEFNPTKYLFDKKHFKGIANRAFGEKIANKNSSNNILKHFGMDMLNSLKEYESMKPSKKKRNACLELILKTQQVQCTVDNCATQRKILEYLYTSYNELCNRFGDVKLKSKNNVMAYTRSLPKESATTVGRESKETIEEFYADNSDKAAINNNNVASAPKLESIKISRPILGD